MELLGTITDKMFDLPLIHKDSNIQNYILPRFRRVVKLVLKTVLEKWDFLKHSILELRALSADLNYKNWATSFENHLRYRHQVEMLTATDTAWSITKNSSHFLKPLPAPFFLLTLFFFFIFEL